jgi:hypothetical protein
LLDDQPAQRLELGVIAPALADHIELAGALGGRDHRASLLHAGGHRLLAQHRHAGRQRRQRHVMVRFRHRHVDDEIRPDLGERALQIGAGMDACETLLVRCALGRLGANIDPPDHRDLVAGRQILAPGAAHPACADDQRFVSFHCILAASIIASWLLCSPVYYSSTSIVGRGSWLLCSVVREFARGSPSRSPCAKLWSIDGVPETSRNRPTDGKRVYHRGPI